jgi:hypothetical protein
VPNLTLNGTTGEVVACNVKTGPVGTPRVELTKNAIEIFGTS